jgi:CBS domain containing-hemolysin-like protein
VIQQVDEATVLADGRLPIAEFNERMGTDVPLDESDTLGGFVFGLLGHQPEIGEAVEWGGITFAVDRTDGRRVVRLRVVRGVGQPVPTGGQGEIAERG